MNRGFYSLITDFQHRRIFLKSVRSIDEDYFKQATAEEKVRKYKHGVAYFEWDARKKRNEALDCRVYALTAVRILQQHRGLDLEQLAEQRPEPDIQVEQESTEAVPANRTRRTSRSTYLNG